MELKEAFFSIRAKKPDLFISAFDHKIVFGPVNDRIYEDLKSFKIDYCNYHQLYIGLFNIVKYLAGETKKCCGSIFQRYKWLIQKKGLTEPNVILYISSAEYSITDDFNEQTFFISFSLTEFNDLIYLLTEVLFLSLNLSFKVLTFFIKLSKEQNLEEFQNFESKDKLQQQIKSYHHDGDWTPIDLHYATELAFYHLDVILCVHKLRTIYNIDKSITFCNIRAMMECEKDTTDESKNDTLNA